MENEVSIINHKQDSYDEGWLNAMRDNISTEKYGIIINEVRVDFYDEVLKLLHKVQNLCCALQI